VADYARAEKFLPQNAVASIYNANIIPHWIGSSSSFWYMNRGRNGNEFFLVDTNSRIKRPAFDHSRLAGALSSAATTSIDPAHLPFNSIEFSDDLKVLQFSFQDMVWTCNLTTYQVHQLQNMTPPHPSDLVSPDKRFAAFVRNNNLFIRDLTSGADFALTTDGSIDNSYARRSDTVVGPVTLLRTNDTPQPYAVWSPDSSDNIPNTQVTTGFIVRSESKFSLIINITLLVWVLTGNQ